MGKKWEKICNKTLAKLIKLEKKLQKKIWKTKFKNKLGEKNFENKNQKQNIERKKYKINFYVGKIQDQCFFV